jgi:pimeloyl-ACP methyl ester carboxylesterase/DNA-binding transcriptional ArsR family regulator
VPDRLNDDIDRIVHEPARLKILGQLYVVESADFLFLMRQTGLTQGNLSSHMSKLEDAGYISVRKEFAGKRPRTLLALTTEGRVAFEGYAESMRKLLKPKRSRRASLVAVKACVTLLLLAAAARGATVEVPFMTHDGYPMLGKLTMPDTGGGHAVVMYVQTAEGMTVDMKRPLGANRTFQYFDLYRTKLVEKNIGFFSYEGRGIRNGGEPPRFETIDREVYNTSTLENKVRDAISAVAALREQPGVDASHILLMGTSEGTLLAAETASRIPDQVHALALYAVLSENMRGTFKFILTDGGFLAYRGFFDTNRDGAISQQEFEADPRRYREQVFRNAPFDTFDRNGDGNFTVDEMRPLAAPLLDAVDADDFAVLDRWTQTAAGVSTPTNWFRDHFAHAPIWTFLEKLDMPVGFFHGEADTNTSAAALRDLEARARAAGKTQMEFHYFPGLDHSLGIVAYFVNGTIPAGHQAIFEFIFRQLQ